MFIRKHTSGSLMVPRTKSQKTIKFKIESTLLPFHFNCSTISNLILFSVHWEFMNQLNKIFFLPQKTLLMDHWKLCRKPFSIWFIKYRSNQHSSDHLKSLSISNKCFRSPSERLGDKSYKSLSSQRYNQSIIFSHLHNQFLLLQKSSIATKSKLYLLRKLQDNWECNWKNSSEMKIIETNEIQSLVQKSILSFLLNLI